MLAKDQQEGADTIRIHGDAVIGRLAVQLV
jgi:hypothetical protein